ncbi:hypothetical protein [Bacillus cereus]|uniref:hypothetical protein n=1 Tax=Bacillus cereus TaxID=1396 RepID=UPI0018F2C7E6|nr:hypothetical protein [Bacillus cereus]MBJ8025007.1 hypothetical protein [Bacillus cereus]MBJ8037483.1 hypothetical protein [Bacillus cereus]
MKYKQALLATVATMTLGVGALGSTVSAFAYEKIPNGIYKIEVPEEGNRIKGRVVDFGAAGKETPLLWEDHQGLNQRWEFKYDTDHQACQIINKADRRILAYNNSKINI